MKTFITLAAIALTITSCSDSSNFNITKDMVGPISKTSTVNELSALFENDSLVDASGSHNFRTPQGDITIFEKGGKKLMKLTPSNSANAATIKSIQIFDDRYQTEEGITIKSTFKDIQDSYTIRSLENFIGSIVIFVEESDTYFTIDKKHLPSNLMFDADAKIELSQIPDDAPIKYIQIGWE